MRVSDFDFDLPDTAIAQTAVEPRDSAKMLHATPCGVQGDYIVRDIPQLLRAGDCLVLNDTKVLPARLYMQKPTGASIECLLHLQKSLDSWVCFAKPAKKCRLGDVLHIADDFYGTITARDGAEITLQFNKSGADLITALHDYGHMPLPPYIKREQYSPQDILDTDKTRYQTVYADTLGAVAAPTAGLHMTQNLLSAVENMGVQIVKITLHVGAGTFLPVKVDDTDDHIMHAEIGIITPVQAHTINQAKHNGGRIIAVGTTALRLLESASDSDGVVGDFNGETRLFITPGYDFKIVDCLMTNYHLPKSTLFMLVSAFLGLDTMQAVYTYALDNGYRFYSYGDSSFLERITSHEKYGEQKA